MKTEVTVTMKSDSEIQKEVLQELKWDTRVEETEVGVEVDKGVVTLTGTVSSYVKRLAAQEAAHRVSGVLDVANDIQVKLPGNLARTDTEVAQAVRRALEWDVLVPDKRIQTTVANGWITLEGTVDLLREREDAERAVCNLIGVKGVSNKISVKASTVRPEEVRRKIEDALERHAQRQAEREAERIKVEVSDGTVSLSGNVRSWLEEQAVVNAVSHAPGVQKVNDRLRISPYA
jgi:osmotically-inducible protein OsmY